MEQSLLLGLASKHFDRHQLTGKGTLSKQKLRILLQEMLVTDDREVLDFICSNFPEEVGRNDMKKYVVQICKILVPGQ